jgi:hypothetical protein
MFQPQNEQKIVRDLFEIHLASKKSKINKFKINGMQEATQGKNTLK